MDIEAELSQRLNAWFASRRKVREWVASHSAEETEDRQQARQFYGLRNDTYDCEWRLLDLGARQDAWERALADHDDFDRADALELRHALPEMDMVAGRQRAANMGLKVSGWWFIPYAVWVGLPRPSRYPNPVDHAVPMLNRVGMAFRDHAQATIPDRLRGEAELLGRSLATTFQFIPCMDADRLREFSLPPGSIDDWPDADRAALDFRPDPKNPLRAGCVGVYLAAPDYKILAMARDMVRELVDEVAGGQQDPDVRIGPLLPRSHALAEAEMMRWELWVKKMLAMPLSSTATTRHVALTVERAAGTPVRLSAVAVDLHADQPLGEPDAFVCRIDRPELLFDALSPFVECQRLDVGWSVHSVPVRD